MVLLIESAAGVNEMLVNCEPSTAGNLAEPSNWTILFAVVPTSILRATEPVVPPLPLAKPMPALTAVMSPPAAPAPLPGIHLHTPTLGSHLPLRCLQSDGS